MFEKLAEDIQAMATEKLAVGLWPGKRKPFSVFERLANEYLSGDMNKVQATLSKAEGLANRFAERGADKMLYAKNRGNAITNHIFDKYGRPDAITMLPAFMENRALSSYRNISKNLKGDVDFWKALIPE